MIGLQECGPAPPRAPASGGIRARERTAQAVEYYNTHVHRAWANAGLSASRSSFNDRHHHSTPRRTTTTTTHHHLTTQPITDHLYRSNSSLELLEHNGRTTTSSSPSLKREYGSHGSIDVIDRPGIGRGPTTTTSTTSTTTTPTTVTPPPPTTTTSESFFAMLQDYRPAVLGVIGADQRSPGPSEYLRSKYLQQGDDNTTNNCDDEQTPQSPKLRVKLPLKFWGNHHSNNNTSNNNNNNNSVNSAVKNQRQTMDDSIVNTTSSSSCNNVICSIEIEEIARRRAFSHYDCQSLTTNLNYAVRLRRVLAKRRNTTTGASAASMSSTRSSTPDGDIGPTTTSTTTAVITTTTTITNNCDEDYGDGQSNDLVQSCPFFRNEIGGEEERIVSLTRLQNHHHHHQHYHQHHHHHHHTQNYGNSNNNSIKKPLHRPPLAYGVAVLEFPPGETHWRHSTCPYQRLPRPIESVDQGALYYRKYFLGQEHQNWFGMDEQLGPVAISIRREKVIHSDNNQLTSSSSSSSSSQIMQYQYRLVIRTSELQTLRGSILEDAIPSIKSSNNSKTLNIKEVLEYVAPEIQLSSLRLGIQNQQTEEQLLKLDEQGLNNHYKVGIMYCKSGQSSEEEMYNNEEAGPAFLEFLETIGKKVRLKGFNKYKAGLDNKSDSTGLYSVYSQYQDCEIMFHVSTMLPFTPNNRQQLLRKRHIGNDIVTIVFQEPGALPFTPKGIRSQFQHVFIVVQAINPCTENTHYKVAVSRSKDVQVFGPPIKDSAIFPKGKAFAEFLLAKVVNAENAAHRSEKFVTMATRTRQEYLKELVMNNSTSTPVDTGQKFSIFSSKKKEKIRPRFIPDACQRGAILWQVLLDDSSQSQQIECFLGISPDTFVLIEEQTKQIVFVTPCKSILGWSLQQTNELRIYHHQGECLTIHIRDTNNDRDELMEIIERLKCCTNGCQAKELHLKRNIMGQLGFHVQPDGIVTLVESAGEAWHSGLRQNSRLVEICKIAVSTLTYDQMVDLLKTSLLVALTVIPPLSDGTPRKGCTLQNCKYNEGNYEGDYENLTTSNNSNCNGGMGSGCDENNKIRKAPQMQQAVPGNHRRMIYERSFSPPRSSNSSGYGTGSSSKSYHLTNIEGTMTSSSSGHSSDDKWYDVLQELEPPPIPQKSSSSSSRSIHNTFPTTPKRNNNNNNPQISHLQISQSHNHFGPQQIHHNKIQVSHSLPLQQHCNYSQPLTATIHNNNNNNNDYELYKLEKNLIKERTSSIKPDDYLLTTRSPKINNDYTTITNDFNRININHDSQSTDSSISDRLYGLGGSEEELSCDNVSPRNHRRKLFNNNNNNSRNQSPRSVNSETKLRPGVLTTPSSSTTTITTRSSNRNSANLSSSNFQEELLKLINPDNIDAIDNETNTNNKTTSTTTTSKLQQSSSRENLKQQPEVILTMARPATVISNASTTSSPLLNSEFIKKDDLLNKKPVVALEELPVPEDWPSLVDTATRVLMQVNSDNFNNKTDEKLWDDENTTTTTTTTTTPVTTMDASITSSVSSSTSVPELQDHVSDLETRLNREIRRCLSLENQVKRLTEENRKYRDQAQTAVQQLRKFTEWFFKNVQRQ